MHILACRAVSDLPAPTYIPTLTFTPRPAPTRTPTPVVRVLRVTDETVNCRFGPGVMYELIDELHQGQTASVVGRNEASTWWYIRDPGNPKGFCWVSENVTEASGDTDMLPVLLPPVTAVKGVRLSVEPVRAVVKCAQFPQTFFFEAQITTNGPTLVNWQWEASTGSKSDVGEIIFDEAGTKVINEFYQVGGPNDYWVKLRILKPNALVEQADFHAVCSP